MNFRNLIPIFGQLLNQLCSIQLTITAAGLDDLGLFLQCEVLPGEIWSYVFFEEGQNLVVRDGTWVGEVVDSGFVMLGEGDYNGEEVWEEGV